VSGHAVSKIPVAEFHAVGCGHTKGKSVVPRGEAYARIQAAVDARNEGQDIFILARTDALIHGWDEAITRAKEFKRIGVDAVFVEALPDRESMQRCVQELGIPTFANIIEGGKTENLSAKDLAELGFCSVAYPWTLVAAKLKSIRETLDALKKSMTEGPPPMILSYAEVCKGVGFNKYWVSYRFLPASGLLLIVSRIGRLGTSSTRMVWSTSPSEHLLKYMTDDICIYRP